MVLGLPITLRRVHPTRCASLGALNFQIGNRSGTDIDFHVFHVLPVPYKTKLRLTEYARPVEQGFLEPGKQILLENYQNPLLVSGFASCGRS
jgi:hypothetical protein